MPYSGIIVAFSAFLFVLFSSGEARAHPGHPHPPEEVDEFDIEAFFSSAAHPFTGFDHLLTMLVAGALASGRRGLGMAFVGAVGAGFLSGLASPPWLLALSLVLIGGFLWKGLLKNAWIWGAVVMTGFVHGGAHSADMTGLAEGFGLCAGTMAGVCLSAAVMSLRTLPPVAFRFAGASVAISGVLLTVARLTL